MAPQSPSNDDAAASAGTVQVSALVVTADGLTLTEKSGDFASGTSALEALKQLILLEYNDTPFGAFVTQVAKKSAPPGYYWALYVDGEYAKVGVSLLRLERDTRLEWRLEKIEDLRQVS